MNNRTTPVRFRRPRRSRNETEHTDRLIFPPTVYTDANYTKGILIPDARSNHGNDGDDSNNEETAHGGSITEEVVVQIPENYFRQDNDTQNRNDNLLPALSQNEVVAWNHHIAAFSAASRRFPMQVARLLGTITLYFDDNEGGTQSRKTTLYNLSEQYCKKNDSAAKKPTREDSNFSKTFGKKQAMNEARLEMGIDENVDETSLPLDVQRQLNRRKEEIFQFWKKIRELEPIQECWSRKYGS